MSGEQLRALRLSLGLTRAQAHILTFFPMAAIVAIETDNPPNGICSNIYGERLKAWQAAGERKDEQ